jgi:hypothetical protein
MYTNQTYVPRIVTDTLSFFFSSFLFSVPLILPVLPILVSSPPLEWRDNVRLSDPKKIRHAIEIGLRGLDTMQKYTGLNKRSSSWSVTLEQDPLGAGKHQEAQEERQIEVQQQASDSNNEFQILHNNVRKLE